MRNTAFGLALLLALCALPALAADKVPNLKGSWVTKSATVAGVKDGLFESPDTASTLVIEDQRDRVFTGYIMWTRRGETFKENIVGGLAPNNTVRLAGAKGGELHGDYDTRAGALVFFYVASGPDAKVVESVYVRTP